MIYSNKFARTTISLPEEVLYELKKKALEKRQTITETVTEGLIVYLKLSPELSETEESNNIASYFGSWGKGPSGKAILKKMRSGKKEEQRDKSLKKSWKKS